MFAFTFRKIHESGIVPLAKNAMIESCVIHAYNLYRFFYQGEIESKNGRKIKRKLTDMIAEDYIGRKAFFRRNRVPKRYFKNLEKKRNKQIAHLTYDRIKMKGWDSNMFRQLWETVDIFLLALPEDKNKEWFSDSIKKASKRGQVE